MTLTSQLRGHIFLLSLLMISFVFLSSNQDVVAQNPPPCGCNCEPMSDVYPVCQVPPFIWSAEWVPEYEEDQNGNQIQVYRKFTFTIESADPGNPNVWQPGDMPRVKEVLFEDLNPDGTGPSAGESTFQPIEGNTVTVDLVNAHNEQASSGYIRFNIIMETDKCDPQLPPHEFKIVDCDCQDPPLCWEGMIGPNHASIPGPVPYPLTPTNEDPGCDECNEGESYSAAARRFGGSKGKEAFCSLGSQDGIVRNRPRVDLDMGGGLVTAGCTSCGGSDLSWTQVDALRFRRLLIPANQATRGSLSPGWFFDFDYRLTTYIDVDGLATAVFFDPASQKSFYFDDINNDNTFEPEMDAYFGSFSITDPQGQPVAPAQFPSIIEDPDPAFQPEVYAIMKRRNGWEYKFRMLYSNDFSSIGRMVSVTSPSGVETTFDYPANLPTKEQILADPTQQLKITSISDSYGNNADITYEAAQQSGRWVIKEVSVGDDSVVYGYNSEGLLSTVHRSHGNNPAVLISSYSYGTDTQWSAATITWYEKLWTSAKRDTLYLASDYMMWDGELVNQYAQVILGRSNGDGERYLSVSRNLTTPNLYRIFNRGRLIQWSQGTYLRYFMTFRYLANQNGYNSYAGTLEPVYAHHPNSNDEQTICASHPKLVSETGYVVDQEYDANGNPTKTIYDQGETFETYELREYGADNRETYYRDRDGFVTLTNYVDGRVVKVIRGMKDDAGAGSFGAMPLPESTQQIYEYYDSSHDNAGLLHWTATATYSGNTNPTISDDEKTTYEYFSNNQLKKVIKPLPAGQTTRPEVSYTWDGPRLETMTNERGQVTTYNYDDVGRLIETQYADGSNEQIRYDDVNNRVYRKNRTNTVARTNYDLSGRAQYRYPTYATDSFLFDNQLDTIHPVHERGNTNLGYLIYENRPYFVERDGTVTRNTYDYRQRVIKVRQGMRKDIIKVRETNYVNNMVFSTEETTNGYTRREYVGHSADQLTVRKISTRNDGVTFADNLAVLNASRVTGADADYSVNDAVRDIRGNLVQVFDARNTETRNEFDALGRQTKTTQAFGTGLALVNQNFYNADGTVDKTIDPAGMVTKMVYDPAGNVQTRTVAHGTNDALTWSYTYDVDGRQKTETRPSGGVFENFYSGCCGRMVGTKDALGHGRITNVNAGGQVVHQAVVEVFDANNALDPVGTNTLSETTTRYDHKGQVQFHTVWKAPLGAITVTDPPIAGIDGVPAADGVTTQYVYFKRLRTLSSSKTISRLGGGTATIDLAPALTKLAAAKTSGGAGTAFKGQTTSTSLPTAGSATVVISPDEKTMSVSITDGGGRSVMTASMTGPAATTPNQMITWNCTQYDRTYTLTGFGTVQQAYRIDPDGEMTSSLADGFGNGVGSLDQDDNLARTKFDEAGSPLEMIDANGNAVSYTYDILGRQRTMTNPVGTTETIYDLSTGRVDSRKDAKGHSTSYQYDIMGRNTITTDRLGKQTTRDYDTAGRLWTLTDAENKTTTYLYDLMDRKTSTMLHDNSVTAYTYDGAGRSESVTMESGRKRVNVYEFSGVLDKIDYFNGATAAGSDDFSYDAQLRRTGSISIDGVARALTYTNRGQLDTDTTTYGGQSYVVDYDYDDRGRNTKTTYPSGRAVEYDFTNRGELDTIKWDGTQIEDRNYDPVGRMTNVDRAHADEVRDYDTASRLTSIDNTGVGIVSYTYDANNNKLTETWTGNMASWSFTTQNSGTYPDGYDAEDRFRDFIRSGQSETVSLDRSDIGNITNFKLNSTDGYRGYSDIHELTSVNGANQGTGTPQTFDDDGNLTASHTGVTFGWNVAGRITQAVVSAIATTGIEGTHNYGYDADGKRVWKQTAPTAGSGSITVYIYSGPNCVAEYTSGAVPTLPIQEYVYSQAIDSLVMLVRNAGTEKLTVTRNQQWCVSALVDNSNGTVVERYAYDALGKRTILDPDGSTPRATSSYNNPHGYTSRRHDNESGLMYFRARYYDSTSGEFASQDPLEYVDGMSLYRGYFVPGDTDPEGREVTKAECEKAVAKAKVDFAAIISNINKKGNNCEIPKFVCGKCDSTVGGTFDKKTNTIKICINNAAPVHLPRLILHELVHAKDSCDGLHFENDCDQLICSEIRAYSFSNCADGQVWRWRGSSRKDCVLRWAFTSNAVCKQCKHFSNAELKERIRHFYPKCVVKPFSDENPVPPIVPPLGRPGDA